MKLTARRRAYYFKVLLPEVRAALKSVGYMASLRDVDFSLRSMYLYWESYDHSRDKWEKHIHTLKPDETDVTDEMFAEFIENVIRFAANDLDWVIAFPGEQLTRGGDLVERLSDVHEHQRN